ncbi:MAG: hypothetical protein CMJ28_03495 [Phycisphaerae bacterium]|nr:hypothetical protein [Phycisphaerae bacterium]
MEPRMSSIRRRAFTIVELLTVMAVIAILSAILLPVLGGALRSGQQAESLNRMRQVAQWMQLYAQDSNNVVLPSRFDYRGQRFAGKVASVPNARYSDPSAVPAGRGTWADILWVRNCQAEVDYVASRRDPADPSDPQLFRVRAPDSMVWNDPSDALTPGFGTLPDWDKNPLRSKSTDVKTSANLTSDPVEAPVPYGNGGGIQDIGSPGFFAANDWFRWLPDPDDGGEAWAISDAVTAESHQEWKRYWTFSQLGNTSKSMYLVDSWRGEVIPDSSVAFDMLGSNASSGPGHVDFRYEPTCLMLFLDGHGESIAPFNNIEELEGVRGQPNPPSNPDDWDLGRGLWIRRLVQGY